MEDSRLYTLLTAAQDALREEVFQSMGDDDAGEIAKESIVLLKEVYRDDETPFRHVGKPGLVITPPRRWTLPAFEGEVSRDYAYYPVAFQFVASDVKRRYQHFRTYSKWEEQLTKLFVHARLPGAGSVTTAHVERVDVMDRGMWITDPHYFVGGIIVKFQSCEARS